MLTPEKETESETAETLGETDTSLEDAGNPGEEDTSKVDLTVLSSTMVYGEVYNMMFYPEEYVGRTIKMRGLFNEYQEEETGNYYAFCIIQDATACCAQGIEFVLTEGYAYPEDYPLVGEEICVEGVFDTYLEDGNTYCTLRNARILEREILPE